MASSTTIRNAKSPVFSHVKMKVAIIIKNLNNRKTQPTFSLPDFPTPFTARYHEKKVRTFSKAGYVKLRAAQYSLCHKKTYLFQGANREQTCT